MHFSPGQRSQAFKALNEAEEEAMRYYCIPPHRRQDLRYDLVMRQDEEWAPLPDVALARTQRVMQIRPSTRAAHDFFRIQLNDPCILTVARREAFDRDLYPFLVFILTHEMVHLVRLSTMIPDESELHLSPEAEEERVQKVAHAILSKAPDRRMAPILEKFCRESRLQPSWCHDGCSGMTVV